MPRLTAGLFALLLAATAPAAEFRLDRRVPCDTSRLDGTPEPPPPYRTRQVFETIAFTNPLYVAAEPGSDRLLVVEQHGRVKAFRDDPSADRADLFVRLDGYETYGLTFHPDYAANRYVYVFGNGPGDKRHPRYNRIFRFTVGRDGSRVCDPASRTLVIEWPSNGHNGGDLCFGSDGYLYVTSGDGTSDSDGDVTGQDLRDLCSGILRLDVDRPDPGKGYAVPKDNPFLHLKDARPELYCFGLRNPWRLTRDPRTDTLWVADIGQDLWEMVHVVRRGANYGWSVYEGSRPFIPTRKLGPAPVTPPAWEQHHAESRSITGGVFYRGDRFPELRDAYLFGDYATGKVWALRHENGKVTGRTDVATTRLQILGFALGHKGDVYLADYGGQIHALEKAPPRPARPDWPKRLSQTGLFLSTADHTPQPGLIPYSVNSPLWSDGAHKERLLALPGTSAATFAEEAWKFPEGSVLVKTFALDRRRVETRLLTFQHGEWQGYSFRWREDQSDADLVPAGGEDRTFTVGGRQQTWHYPSRTECMVCHSRAAGFVLGPNTRQMNRVHDYGGARANQIDALVRLGALRVEGGDHLRVFEGRCQLLAALLKGLPPVIPRKVRDRLADRAAARVRTWWAPVQAQLRVRLEQPSPLNARLPKPSDWYGRLADPYDPAGDVAARARSYLHANCAHCHVEAGGGNAAINLHVGTQLGDMRLLDVPPLHDAFGLRDARLVAPGDPDRSVLLHRITTRGRGQMPPLASSVADDQAAALLRRWIIELRAPAAR